ncbi:iron ABC transporter substrate-binding protein [Cryobacterium melibiosiphilum]|uniref:Iron ABC transporter substrate-binding protein n=1 Tax=Cryobacterium melibiosiphilum TaxID=995039 RepID=A0A3A5MM33_9MICO|nr:ABC transporter substrate-binding protein [Cryobacterium melibiosiphilum]RJT88899.1 iron ABC transporter substrate-binding protein [Cryobacterium melibiosiphilum]
MHLRATRPRTRTATRTAAALATVAALGLLSACAATPTKTAADAAESAETATPTEISVTHAQGETIVPVNPVRVLTFDIASLTTLDALGVDVLGLPKANLPGDLDKFNADDYLNIGTLFEPDYEAVNAAAPDLIIVAGRSAAVYPELAAIAPTIDLTNDAADFTASVIAGTETLGEIFEKQDEVASMVATLEDSIADVQDAAADAGDALIVMTNAGEITAFGPGSRFGFLHDTLGITPAVDDVEAATHGEAVSFEFLVETDPAWMFVVDRDSATASGTGNAAEVLDNELVAQTAAAQDDHIVFVDPVSWYIVNGGLVNLQAVTNEVAAALAE